MTRETERRMRLLESSKEAPAASADESTDASRTDSAGTTADEDCNAYSEEEPIKTEKEVEVVKNAYGGLGSLLEANYKVKHKREIIYGSSSTTAAYWSSSKLINVDVPKSVSWAMIVDLFYKRYATVFATANTKAFFDIINAFSDGVRQEQWCLLMLLDAIICRLTHQIPNGHRSQRRNFNHHEEFATVVLIAAGLLEQPKSISGLAAERIGQEGQRKGPQVVPAEAPSSVDKAIEKDNLPLCGDINTVISRTPKCSVENSTSVSIDPLQHVTKVNDIHFPWTDICNFKPTNKNHNQRGIRTKIAVYNGVINAGLDLTNMQTIINAVVNLVIYNRESCFLSNSTSTMDSNADVRTGARSMRSNAWRTASNSDSTAPDDSDKHKTSTFKRDVRRKVGESGGVLQCFQGAHEDTYTTSALPPSVAVDLSSDTNTTNGLALNSATLNVASGIYDAVHHSEITSTGIVDSFGSIVSTSSSDLAANYADVKRGIEAPLVVGPKELSTLGIVPDYEAVIEVTHPSEKVIKKRSRSGIPTDITGVRYDRTKPLKVNTTHGGGENESIKGQAMTTLALSAAESNSEPNVSAEMAHSAVATRIPRGWVQIIDPMADHPYFLHRASGTVTTTFPTVSTPSIGFADFFNRKITSVKKLFSPDSTGKISDATSVDRLSLQVKLPISSSPVL